MTEPTPPTDPLGSQLPDPVTLRAKIAQQVEDARKHAAEVADMNQRLQRLEGVASSPGGHVRVRVNAKCVLTDLELGEQTIRLGRRSLAKLILETTMEAQRMVAREALAIADGTLGEELLTQMRNEYLDQLGHLDDDEPGDNDRRGNNTWGVQWNR